MKRSRLRNKFLRTRTEISQIEYKKQRNLCVNLLKKAKKDHYANLDLNCMTDNKKFWQTVKPLFSNKVKAKTVIKLVENDETVDDEAKLAKIFNEYFVNIVKNLGILTYDDISPTENHLSEVDIAIRKYKNHPSIIAITDKMNKIDNPEFNFRFTSYEETKKEVGKLKIKKASQKTDIPVKIIRENIDVVSYFIYHNFNNLLSCVTFSTALKYADVTPAHKKDDKTNKENYRPISILPNLSKVYERLIYNQIYPYFNNLFSKFQCGFRKGFNAQHCLLTMIEKWRTTLDAGGETGAVLTDLSKAFDCINHNLLIAKLNAYGFDKQAVSFIHSYITKRKQRTKVDSAYSSWEMLLTGVPQGSILGPLLFNIYICDMFFETPQNICFAGYADDNTPYTYSSKIEEVLSNLENALKKLFQWFSDNYLVANASKCHLLTSSKTPKDITISNSNISSEEKVKLLGINIEGRLNFDSHVNTLLSKANKKYHALARVCNYMDINKRRLLMNAFIISQFSYCPLVWMFHSRGVNNKINSLHEKSLRLIYKNKPNLSFDDLLKENKSVKIHQRNLQTLATEIYKVKNDLGPEIMKEVFQFIEKPYNLRNNSVIQRHINRTVYFGTESITSLAPRIWEILPVEIKNAKSLGIFKEKIKTWTTDKCPCRLCKKYIANVGFI